MEFAAEAANICPDLLRTKNMYALGDTALCGVVIGERGFNWNLPAMWVSVCLHKIFLKRAVRVNLNLIFGLYKIFPKRAVRVNPEPERGFNWNLPAMWVSVGLLG